MKLSLSPNLLEKQVWVPVVSLCKFSFPVSMPYYAETGHCRPLIMGLYTDNSIVCRMYLKFSFQKVTNVTKGYKC
jgi:hypothetical protein